jgi:hypothetical protein
LEIFFSGLRQRFGSNNNPTAIQLEYALKRLLVVRIGASPYANCIEQEILETKISPMCNRQSQQDFESGLLIPPSQPLSLLANNVVTYIAGYIASHLGPKISCEPCYSSLFAKSSAILCNEEFTLIDFKNNGGLAIPSPDLVKTCKFTEGIIQGALQSGIKSLKSETIHSSAIERLSNGEVFHNQRCLFEDEHYGQSHREFLIRSIVKHYTKVRLYHVSREESYKIQPGTLRSKLTKLITFRGN